MSFFARFQQSVERLEHLMEPILLFMSRLFMFDVFFSSGMLKLENYLNNDWASTVLLFEEVHPVPLLSPHTAAVLGTGTELIFSLLLLVGLFGRLSAFILLCVTGIIELSFQFYDPQYITFDVHILWALLLGFIFVLGSGKLSLDHLLLNVVLKRIELRDE